MIAPLDKSKAKILGFKLSGKLHHGDYEKFVAAIDEVIASHGPVRILAQFENFEGWDLRALWDDLKFTAKHFNAIQRIAFVSDDGDGDRMNAICSQFIKAEVRYFCQDEIEEAWQWIRSDSSDEL